MTTYAIEIRNRKLPGDRWQWWGVADGDENAAKCARALRAAFGKRYEVRRRRVDTEGSAK